METEVPFQEAIPQVLEDLRYSRVGRRLTDALLNGYAPCRGAARIVAALAYDAGHMKST